MERKRRRGSETRELLLEEAAKAFAERGFRGTSLAAIAAAVGVSRQALVNHFADKTELFLAVLQRQDDRAVAAAQEVVAQTDGGLVEVFVALERRNRGQGPVGQPWPLLEAESLDPAHPAHEWFKDRDQRLRTRLAEGLHREQAAGRLRADADPDRLAGALIAVLSGLALQRLRDPDFDSPAALEALLELLVTPSQAPAARP